MMGLEPRLLISAVVESCVYIHKTIEVLMSIGVVVLLECWLISWLVCCCSVLLNFGTLVMMDRNV